MKRRILLAVLGFVTLCVGANDRFYIEDFSIAAGKTRTVSIMLDNELAYTAFQSDISLSEGLTVNESSFALTDRKNSNHTFTAQPFYEGMYRMMSYSLALKSYSGNSGALVTFDVTASDDFEGPAVITLSNTLFTTVAGIEIAFDSEECTVTLCVPGDVNGDKLVNITDVTALVNYLLTDNVDGVNLWNADVNDDELINITDVTRLVNFLLTDQW